MPLDIFEGSAQPGGDLGLVECHDHSAVWAAGESDPRSDLVGADRAVAADGTDLDGLSDQRLGSVGSIAGGLDGTERRYRSTRHSQADRVIAIVGGHLCRRGKLPNDLLGVDAVTVRACQHVEPSVDELDRGFSRGRTVRSLELDDCGGYLLLVDVEPQRRGSLEEQRPSPGERPQEHEGAVILLERRGGCACLVNREPELARRDGVGRIVDGDLHWHGFEVLGDLADAPGQLVFTQSTDVPSREPNVSRHDTGIRIHRPADHQQEKGHQRDNRDRKDPTSPQVVVMVRREGGDAVRCGRAIGGLVRLRRAR